MFCRNPYYYFSNIALIIMKMFSCNPDYAIRDTYFAFTLEWLPL